MSDDEAELARLFAEAVPEVANGSVKVKAITRNRGYRSKLALTSDDPKIDAVGVCVGIRGCRIKQVIDRLDGERIDLVRWNDSPEIMIPNALQPANISEVILDPAQRRAKVVVAEDQLSLAIGRGGMNRDLASQICGWEIDIATE